jgi:transposase
VKKYLHFASFLKGLQAVRVSASLCFFICAMLASCQSAKPGQTVVVKPRYHHTWYKNHIYKKKWHIGRIKFEPEKQGVKRVKMKG